MVHRGRQGAAGGRGMTWQGISEAAGFVALVVLLVAFWAAK
jgi:hypothetical protein